MRSFNQLCIPSCSYVQIINVYDQKYESAAAFWPDVNRRLIIGLIISQLLLMGLLSTKGVSKSTPVLIVLPVLTIWFHRFCKGRFESAFVKFPLQVRPDPSNCFNLICFNMITDWNFKTGSSFSFLFLKSNLKKSPLQHNLR